MSKLSIIKIGGKVIDNPDELGKVLKAFSTIPGQKILVHGGGSLASRMEESMGLVPKMIEGRRVTSKESLEVVTMVYAGLINKNIVATLQKFDVNGIGLSGADGNTLIAKKRTANPIDFGFVGDVEEVNSAMLNNFLELGLTPVICAITHDGNGQLLNTNADTMASVIAQAMARTHRVELVLAFEKAGVLDADGNVIPGISRAMYEKLLEEGVIIDGMIPKLSNAFEAIENGVDQVKLVSAEYLVNQDVEFTTLIK